jgi:hypothetical protein
MAFFSGAAPDGSDSDPFDLIRLAARVLLALGTGVAVFLWATGITPHALLVIGALWSLYGFTHAVLDGLLDPLLDFSARAIQSVGLSAHQQGYSHIETMVARGDVDAAAQSYAHLAAQGDAGALVRRAELLGGRLGGAEKARIELEEFRETRHLPDKDDIRIGLALARLFEQRLDDPGRAMREIRRLLDLYPRARGLRHLERTLAALKHDRFGGPA